MVFQDKDATIRQLVNFINQLVEGDDPFPELGDFLKAKGFWDEDGFPIGVDDD
jgi:hypothetical protein